MYGEDAYIRQSRDESMRLVREKLGEIDALIAEQEYPEQIRAEIKRLAEIDDFAGLGILHAQQANQNNVHYFNQLHNCGGSMYGQSVGSGLFPW